MTRLTVMQRDAFIGEDKPAAHGKRSAAKKPAKQKTIYAADLE